MINRNLLIFILGIFILLNLRNKNLESNKCNQKEYMIDNQNEEVDTSNSVIVFQDADKILNNLDRDLSIKLLINNNLIIPWIKNMEESEAEELYERLFEDNTLDENLTMKELLYGKTDEDGNIILDSLQGVDLDISLTNLLKDKQDVQEYNELTKFLKKVYLDEIMEWGNKFKFEFILDELNILSSVKNPSLNEIRNIPLQIININSDKINTSLKNQISFNINDLVDEDEKNKLNNSLKIRYFKIQYIGLNKKPQTNLIKFKNKLDGDDIIFSFINKNELNSIPVMEENIPVMEENIPVMEENQFRSNNLKIKDNTNVKIFPVISLFLKSKSESVEVNGKTYNFKLDKIGNINNIIDPTNWQEGEYKLSFPTSFPDQYKLRVRNNKSNIYSALSNIINSFGIKQGLDWKKDILNGNVILDTTIGPNNILSLNKNVLNRIVK